MHAVEIRSFSKTFPGQRALTDFDLVLEPGEIHALVGENGCGKSTFIKCLSGYQAPDGGAELNVRGKGLAIPYTAAQAVERGLVFVHQDFGIVPTLSVMENMALGAGFATRGGRIQWRTQANKATEALAILGREDIPPHALASTLSASEHATIAIARALASAKDGASLIVLDEPTAALPRSEVDALFQVVRRLAEQGTAVLFVSHRLQEVFDVAHRVTVLRDSKKIGTFDIADLDERTLVQKIVGRDLVTLYPESAPKARESVVLEVEGLTATRVSDVSFTAHRGEILGIAGLQGSGRSEIIRLLFGAQQRRSGRIRLHGQDVDFRHPASAIQAGIAHVPEDRIHHGVFGRMTVAENLSLLTVGRYWKYGRIQVGPETKRVRELIGAYDIRPGNAAQMMGRLSGGNQQKGVLAKWIEISPTILLLDEPAQGVDVGSKSDIYHLIEQWVAEHGSTVIMVSSDFEDLNALCHRVLVLRDGQLVAELENESKTVDRMVELAYLKDAG
ncbi:monosaccharide-transporting ATPase (plasmid) [Rhodococcus jostii RHA1]|uniref:Monosaccharide-transporting ATPase n=1 Tax=Rhodococcus jostii (strain RHA1) TaxID=101510 RepID=Q0RZ01_RHOJR|nr:sugar ABC transporter ATP-binding protein [Rhodococcus jostii]ABG99485.1 monosaccharide-transporting ATPase [Rhodococcus jostii RHA1]